MPLGKRMDAAEMKPRSISMESDVVDKGTVFTLFQAEEPQYSFNDIVLNKSTYDAIQDVLVLYQKKELLFDKWGLGQTHKKQNRSGINLYGCSGTGKSMAAHAIADQLGRKILTVDYSRIESKYVGID